jgi:predicted O-methyltransferase YrrM
MKRLQHSVLILCLLGISVSVAVGQDSGNRRSQRGGGVMAAAAPVPKDDAERPILQVLEELDRTRGMGVPRDDGRLLRMLVESIGAKHVVELGTFRGYSGIWICLGLRTTDGKLTTFEIDEENARTARANFKRAGVDSLVEVIVGDAHKEVVRVTDPVDLVFIDADKEGYLDYLNKLLPVVRPGGLVVAHNIDPGRADPGFVDAITTNPQLDTIFVTTGSGGISLSMKKR